MVDLPQKISETKEKLRKDAGGRYIEIKVIRGHYYAFEVKGSWDKVAKKKLKHYKYLGRILEDGTFNAVRHKNRTMPEDPSKKESLHEANKIQGKYDEIILRNLSMNARMPVPMLAERLNLSITATRYHINRIKDKYNLEYIAEIDAEKLGYLSYVSFVKFKNKMPSPDEIRKSLEPNPQVQLVMLAKGKYDLVICFLARTNRDIAEFVYNLQSFTAFGDYSARWYTTPLFDDYNFIPLRNKFFDLVKPTASTKAKNAIELSEKDKNMKVREYVVLKELNKNGAEKFSEIDSKYGLNIGASQYAYHNLKENNIIRRITINTKPPELKYNVIFLMQVIHGKKIANTRGRLLKEIIEDSKIINKYAFVGDTEIPHGIFFVLPVTDQDQAEATESHMRNSIEGINLHTLFITNVILGTLCYRKFDKSHSNQSRALVDKYKMTDPDNKANYE